MAEIKQVAVLGAGTMGSGIAGICANAGCQVLLLDMETAASEAAKIKLSTGRSPVLQDPAVADRITTGSFSADLQKIADCDWICEAIVEDLAIKREMFSQIEAMRSAGSILSTNTSGIPLKDIYANMPPRLQQDIAVTHFFNPVHLMKLVELVPGEQSKSETIDTLADFLGKRLGKGVVYAKDTVNFIGNRIGCMWMLAGMHLAEKAMHEDGLDIETVDALTSAPLGLPPTGLYGLIDLVGLDVMFNVGKNLEVNLPPADVGRKFTSFTSHVQRLHDRGQLGRKSGGGFYQLTRHEDGSKTMQVFDLAGDRWRAAQTITLPENEQTLRDLFASDSANGRFIKDLVTTTLCYAADLVPQIANDIVNVDRAMRWGFNWQYGPFEMIDQLGARTFIALLQETSSPLPAMLRMLEESGKSSFYRNAGKEYLNTKGQWDSVQVVFMATYVSIQATVKELCKKDGKIMTYGQVADKAHTSARAVGGAMKQARANELNCPWWRVMKKSRKSGYAEISDGPQKEEQRPLLEKEGVCFDSNGRVNLAIYGCNLSHPNHPPK